MSIKALLTGLMLGAMPVLALAQTAQPPAQQTTPNLTPAQQAQLEQQNVQMAEAAMQIIKMIDQNDIGTVWDQASNIARQASTRQDFIRQLTSDRATLGAPGSRTLAGITRTRSNGENIPAGFYVNISYATQFAKMDKPVRELVSYHLDDDRIWRVAGYTLR